MAKKTRGAAVIGTGFGFITHVRALEEAGIQVEAIVGRDPEKTQDRARRASIPHALTSVDEALALPNVDLVTIATPPHTHAQIAVKACEAGKHVMCEKPFAANLSEAERMLEAAEKSGIVHALGTEFRFQAPQAVATRALSQGLIGDPRMASFMLLMPVLAGTAAEVPDWWSDAGEGGGWLGAYASHVIDQTRTMLGEWTGLSASLNTLSGQGWSADDSFTIHFRTAEGCSGILQSSSAAYGAPFGTVRISGRDGTIEIVGEKVILSDAIGTRELEVPEELANGAPKPTPDMEVLTTTYDTFHMGGGDVDPFAKLFRSMVDTIDGRVPSGPALATFADGVALQRIMDAIRRSNELESWEVL